MSSDMSKGTEQSPADRVILSVFYGKAVATIKEIWVWDCFLLNY